MPHSSGHADRTDRADPSADLSPQSILNAMDGLAYLADTEGVIRVIGQPSWDRFVDEAGAPGARGEAIVGRSIFEMIEGREIAEVTRTLHEAVGRGRRNEIVFNYRCDAPALKRQMRMAITAVRIGGDIAGVLYQSHLLWEAQRPPVGLFDPARHATRRPAEPETRTVRLCSYCHEIAWPPGPPADDIAAEWIPPEEYYRRGGGEDVLVSHAACPRCHRMLMAEISGGTAA